MTLDLEADEVRTAISTTYAVGACVIAEAARVDGLHLIVPEVESSFSFDLDGVRFRITISVEPDEG